MEDKIFKALRAIGIIVLMITLYLGMIYLFMLAFNYVARYFGFKEITYWVAFVIAFLLGFIGFRPRINKK